jgi:hypothetical protein
VSGLLRAHRFITERASVSGSPEDPKELAPGSKGDAQPQPKDRRVEVSAPDADNLLMIDRCMPARKVHAEKWQRSDQRRVAVLRVERATRGANARRAKAVGQFLRHVA